MKLDRTNLIDHLSRISCEEEITEVVLNADLSVAAMTPDQAFFVSAPKWSKKPILPEALGVISLTTLLKALNKLVASDKVEFTYEENRLIIEEGVHRLRLMVADPDVIGTRVDEDNAKMIVDTIHQGESFDIPKEIAHGILDIQDLLNAMELTLIVTPEGSKIWVGPETGHNDVISWDGLKGDGEYKLILQANAMVAALKQIKDYDTVQFVLTGEDSSVAIVDNDDFVYVLSPTGE